MAVGVFPADLTGAAGLGETGLNGRQAVELATPFALFEIGIGFEHQQGAVLVVQHLGRDEVLEKAALLASLLEVLEVGIEIEGVVRITAEVVGAEKVEQNLERIRKACVRAFSLLELEPVNRRIDLI